MKTILVTGNDTNIGKTWVTASIAHFFAKNGKRTQVVKPAQTGGDSDVDTILNFCERNQNISGYTLFSYEAPLAPVCAAMKEGKSISMESILNKMQELPSCEYRIIEGAGGIGVPIDPLGYDFRDLAFAFSVDYMIMVIENRLGAINQARLMHFYAPKETIKTGLWLNDVSDVDEEVTQSNIKAFRKLDLPLWAHQKRNQREIPFLEYIFN